ncbi:unnamed protein product [Colias eurytheme]|nr:unnamed protein product [Colias eurytheme]
MERNPERFKAWVHIVGGKLETPSDGDLSSTQVVTVPSPDLDHSLPQMTLPLPEASTETVTGSISQNAIIAEHSYCIQSDKAVLKNKICDQSATNVAAINEMIEETKRKYFQQNKEWRHSIIEVSGKQIVPLFDVPHLIKGVRNNLLTKDIKYFDFEEQVEKIIKWQYYQQVYEADQSYGELKLLQKIDRRACIHRENEENEGENSCANLQPQRRCGS